MGYYDDLSVNLYGDGPTDEEVLARIDLSGFAGPACETPEAMNMYKTHAVSMARTQIEEGVGFADAKRRILDGLYEAEGISAFAPDWVHRELQDKAHKMACEQASNSVKAIKEAASRLIDKAYDEIERG